MNQASEQNTYENCDDNGCPVCGDLSHPLLSPVDVHKLILAVTTGTDHPNDQTIERIFNAAIGDRLRSRSLELTLTGQLVPHQLDENGKVLFGPIEQRLTPEEVTKYRKELEELGEDTFDNASEDLLTATEQERLAMATITGLGNTSQPYLAVEAVINWAKETRQAEAQLEAILAGRLLPFIPAGCQGLIALKDFGVLPAKQRDKYGQALAALVENQFHT